MTTKPARTKRRSPRRPVYLDDLLDMGPEDPFRKEIEELRWHIAEHPRPIEEWTESDREEFARLAKNEFLLVGLGLASLDLNVTVTSENPHRNSSHDAD